MYRLLGTGQVRRQGWPGQQLGFVLHTTDLWSSGSDFSRGLGLGQLGNHLLSVLGGAESCSEPLGTPWCGPG